MNQDCDYFIDDRFYYVFIIGLVLIFMGIDKVDEFLLGNFKNFIIKVSDFKSLRELVVYLEYFSKNEIVYNKYLVWKWKGLGDILNIVIGCWWKL